jgi:hypothetical protein
VVVTRWPAMVTTTALSAPLFAATFTRTDALPLPDDGVTDAHELSLDALHEHALCVRTSIVVDPPLGSMTCGEPAMSYRHGAGCCETEMLRSATEMVPWRATGSAF